MKKVQRLCYTFLSLMLMACGAPSKEDATTAQAPVVDPLPSWNDGVLKRSIVTYVEKVTDSLSADFIPVQDRIATFDNDGTLWAERPYVQELFAFYRVQEMVKQKPELKSKQPFKAVIEKDKSYFAKGGEKALLQLVVATHTGITEDEFELSVKNFFASAKYPKGNVPIKNITYKPQLELLNYLRDNNFKTFICTGGTMEFVRGISEELYGIPKDQVVGTTFKYKFMPDNGTVIREPTIDFFNDKEGKPAGIQEHIGQRPVFACGNEGGGGDIAMLRYCQGSKYTSFQMIINHDDSTREFFYQEKDSASLKAAMKNKWNVVSMKNDWETVFATELKAP
jgi:phosphoserine phosphatase